MKKGLTLPNLTWGGWTEEEMQNIVDLHPDVVQVLVFHQQPDWVWAIQQGQLLALHNAIGCEFEYRLCGVGPADNPEDIADWAKEKLRGLPTGKVIPGNEFNHPIEGWIGSDWLGWLRRFARAWTGEHKLITPALSPNFNDYITDMGKMLGLVEEGFYDYLGVHVYSDDHIIGLGQARVCITECNGELPETVLSWVDNPLCEEAIWFSSKWIDPDPDYRWDLIGNQELSASFMGWQGAESTSSRVSFSNLSSFGMWANREETDEELLGEEATMAQFQIGNKYYDSLIGELPIRLVPRYRKRAFSDIEEITIHHSGSNAFLLDLWHLAEEMVTHQDPNRCKYPEIPYHIVIDSNGRLTVCQPLDALTWHADGGEPRQGVGINNWRGVGICLIGDFTQIAPTLEQLEALKEVSNEIDFAMGKVLRRVRHSDVQQTSCPGDTSRGDNNWFDGVFNLPSPPPPDYETLKARNTFLEEQNAAYKNRSIHVETEIEKILTYIRLNH